MELLINKDITRSLWSTFLTWYKPRITSCYIKPHATSINEKWDILPLVIECPSKCSSKYPFDKSLMIIFTKILIV